MLNRTCSKLIFNQFLINNIYLFSSKNRSYYQILDVKPNCTSKQLRSKFLKKARLLHPDHNPDSNAQQQFKILKDAYQTLKDPQKRYMYDTGISVQPGQQSQMHKDFHQNPAAGRKYYQNRWYKYQKSKYKDVRDQFYTQRSQFVSEQEQNPYRNRIIMFFSLIVGIFGYDYYYSRMHKLQHQNKMTKQLLEDSVQTKKRAAIMKKYIQSRSKQHIVQQ